MATRSRFLNLQQRGKLTRKFDPVIANWVSKRLDFKSQAEKGIFAVEGPRERFGQLPDCRLALGAVKRKTRLPIG